MQNRNQSSEAHLKWQHEIQLKPTDQIQESGVAFLLAKSLPIKFNPLKNCRNYCNTH